MAEQTERRVHPATAAAVRVVLRRPPGCQGCGEALALRQILKVAGPEHHYLQCNRCMEIITSPYPETAWACARIHVAFENALEWPAGVEAGSRSCQKKTLFGEGKL